MDQETTVPTTESNLPARVWDYIKSHKKLILVIVAVIFLFIALGITIFQAFKDKLLPGKIPTQQTGVTPFESTSQASIQIQTSKNNFSLNEKVPISVTATSNGEAVRAFDVLIEFDPEYLSLTNERSSPAGKKSPTKPEFEYYGNNTGTLLQVSAVQKPDISADQVFDNSGLFEFEFTPKKA